MIANIRLLAPLTRRQQALFATIKIPIDAVKFSNTIQLSPNSDIMQLDQQTKKEKKNTCRKFISRIVDDDAIDACEIDDLIELDRLGQTWIDLDKGH